MSTVLRFGGRRVAITGVSDGQVYRINLTPAPFELTTPEIIHEYVANHPPEVVLEFCEPRALEVLIGVLQSAVDHSNRSGWVVTAKWEVLEKP